MREVTKEHSPASLLCLRMAIEEPIIRRCTTTGVEGYTLPLAEEILAGVLAALSPPDAPAVTDDLDDLYEAFRLADRLGTDREREYRRAALLAALQPKEPT